MKEINFFESYIEKQEFKVDKEIILYFSITALMICMAFCGIINQIRISKFKKEVYTLKEEVENETVQSKVEELKQRQTEIVDLKKNLENIKQVDEYITDEDIINEYLLQSITARIPKEVFFESMLIDSTNIQIEGVSRDRYSIAEFEYSLKNNIGFENVFISNITLENAYYKFSLNLRLKEEDEDDNGYENESQEKQSEEEQSEEN